MPDAGPAGPVRTRLDYVPSGQGELLVTRFMPALPVRTAVLCLPPFAEELNKSRRMLALQGRQLAAAGMPFVLPDLHGTGDSDGLFEDASWEAWLDDVAKIVRWLQADGVDTLHILGVRSGLYLLDAIDGIPVERVALWSPVTNGARMLKQILRSRLIAAPDGSGAVQPSALLEQLETEGSMELTGYRFSKALWQSIDQSRIKQFTPPATAAVCWYDIAVRAREEPTPPMVAAIAAWQAAGCSVEFRAIAGPPFWLGPEIEEIAALLDSTTSFLAGER